MKRRKSRKPPRGAPAFAGMTPADCCRGCVPDRCLISGGGYCAHPRKGGLQGADMCDIAAVKRLEAAARTIGKPRFS